jgi:hypothetical protein
VSGITPSIRLEEIHKERLSIMLAMEVCVDECEADKLDCILIFPKFWAPTF